MRNKNFFDAHQAQRYLNDSIIRLANDPIYIAGIEPTRSRTDYKLFYYPIPFPTDAGSNRLAHKIIPLKDKNINLNPVPLGFINAPYLYTADAYVTLYAYRMPIRTWSIGLTRQNLMIVPTPDTTIREDDRMVDNALMQSQALKDTIQGVYPSAQQAIRTMRDNKNIRGIAFSRNFAINQRNELFFKWNTQSVGIIRDDLSFRLFDDNKYLVQSLTEDVAR